MSKGVIFRDGKTGKAVKMNKTEFLRYMKQLWIEAQVRKDEKLSAIERADSVED